MTILNSTFKSLAGRLLIIFLVSAQLVQPVHAAATDIADSPMAVKYRVKPNIMFTLDNSGSMAWQEMPDEVWNYCSKRSYRSSSYNRVYYNPNYTYPVPVDANGNTLPVPAWPNAYIDGFTSTSTRNISTSFRADEYGCNAAVAANYCTYNAGATTILTSPTDNAIVNNDANFTCINLPTAQQTNFIIWHSYYRTRMLAMKSALSLSFSTLNDQYRVGFYTINDNSGSTNTSGANFLNTADFTTGQKATWFTRLFAVTPNGGTPVPESLRRVGEYYRTGTLPGASGSIDPIQQSCQPNYHIVSTDGYWNVAVSTTVGNHDQTVPTLPATISLDPISGTALTPASAWPRPFYEGTTASSNNLADIAMYYWATDLRTLTNNVLANSSDPATWQHVSTFTIGMGVDGTLAFNATTLANLKSGTTNWPVPTAGTASTIDDLWHAAINGHGQYFSGKDPSTLKDGLTAALNDIVGREGAAAAVTVSNNNVTANDNSSYSSSFHGGNWTGDLQAYPINLTTGIPDTNAPLWTTSAQAQLDALTWTNRKIGSFSGSAGIPFTWASLSTGQKATLHTPPSGTDGATVLNFLRGDRSLEGTTYRTRSHVLGDIINAESVYVAAPIYSYADSGYSAYKTANASRAKMVYQAANDGMLHAFSAGAGGGAEQWAYVPGLLFDSKLPSNATTSKLVNLSAKSGFVHYYYVDGTPIVGDLDFSNTAGVTGNPPADWHTILVGGLGKGGRGYYALDVTNPSALSDTDVANKVLWEFPNSSTNAIVRNNIGLSYASPILVKTTAKGWVILVTSGYNNGSDTSGDGQGHLFVLDAKTGDLLKDIPTGVGSSATPSGLAHISGYVATSNLDNTVEYVYGGDLEGNLWRFDLTGTNSNAWGVAKLATLVDGAVTSQPITTAPELGIVNGKRLVFVGTGQYLGNSDVPGTGANIHAAQTQSYYGLVDDLTSSPLISPLRTSLQQQTLTTSGLFRTASSNTVNYNTQKGWYVDLPDSGERAVTNAALALGALIFTSNIPNIDPCTPGGSSWLYFLDYKTGGFLTGSTVSWTAKSLGNKLGSRPTIVKLPNGTVKTVIKQSDGSVDVTAAPLPTNSGGVNRVSWREIITE
ncbi:MAG: PilC/PilY family type IV pilus protein [Pseudomonadota bacterium]